MFFRSFLIHPELLVAMILVFLIPFLSNWFITWQFLFLEPVLAALWLSPEWKKSRGDSEVAPFFASIPRRDREARSW